ncbi:MAG: hypothetical protein KDE19_13715 [Caldilineaceae bacterium]|nr:hypothetical protein [Caldilineaceae bacterium]
MKPTRFITLFLTLLLAMGALLSACRMPEMPQMPELPTLPDLPAIPQELQDLPNLARDLGLPDLGSISNLPTLEDLPGFQTPPGAIVYNGPTEHSLQIGDRLPGTDIVLTGIAEDRAEFQIAGMRSQRTVGDSLDFDGTWPGIGGVDYNARYRIYYVGSSSVRAAGVHRVVIHDIQPTEANVTLSGNTMKFPFTVNVSAGGQIAGTTLGYVGQSDRGGEISGLPAGDYPFHKIGDSIPWKGFIRADVPATYNIRMLYYDANQAQVGGIVTIALPG